MKTIKIKEVIGSPAAILHPFGIKVFEELMAIHKGNPKEVIHLDFSELQGLTSAFCNASIGNFYSKVPNAASVLKPVGLPDNPIWLYKIKEAIDLAINDIKSSVQAHALDTLYEHY